MTKWIFLRESIFIYLIITWNMTKIDVIMARIDITQLICFKAVKFISKVNVQNPIRTV